MKPIVIIILFAFLLGASHILNAGAPCRDRDANRLIERMGPVGAAAFCPGWEEARREYNVRRDVPTIPIPQGEYRVRLHSPNRR